MKRFLVIIFTLTCLMAAFCPAFAAEACTVPPAAAEGKYATMGDLYQAWGGHEGYPDYICGVWSTDGGMENLTVAVTDDAAGEQGREEILSLLENTDSVTFTTLTYSYQELSAIMEEVSAQMGGDSLIIGCGVYEMDNTVHIMINKDGEGADAVAKDLAKQYGGKVLVEMTGPFQNMIAEDAVLTYGEFAEETNRMPVILLIAALAAAGAALALKLKPKKK
ncbi:MAG: hypothetical protein IKU58_07805 [Clostridia bacterium]|nr:hypothetical protein [Clostridia bacterium]